MIVYAKKTEPTHQQQSGSILVIIIIAIVLVASVGAAILSNTSSSTFTQLGSVDSLNGYFLAETGKYYALEQIKQEISNSESPTGTSQSCTTFNLDNCTTHTARTFTLPNTAGQFSLSLTITPRTDRTPSVTQTECDNNATLCIYHLTSIGIPNSHTNRVVKYEFSQQ